MSGLQVVLPVMYVESADRCINSTLSKECSSGIEPEELLIVDNSRDGFAKKRYPNLEVHRDPNNHNLGVARSWNIGARIVLEQKLDYLVILSASLEFGPLLHTTWRGQMERYWGRNMIEAMGHSWHLIAIHRDMFEMVGLFDENFYPAYEEQIDFGHRQELLGVQAGYTTQWVNAMSWGHANHIWEIHAPNPPLVEYYISKWGGIKGEEKWDKPFSDKPIDYWEERSIPELAKKYKLKTWW